MRFRRVPPVYSPLGVRALWGGARAALGNAETARQSVLEWIDQTFNPRQAILTDSGTTALTLAIRIARQLRGGGPVALPAYCCYDIATAADGAEADVLLYDLDPHTLGPDWDSLERTLAVGPAAVVVAHLYGHPVDIHMAQTRADSAGSLLIEDAAQGIGASYEGQPLGSFGAMSVLSFGRGKGLTGGGGGGLLAHQDDLLALVAEQAGTLGSAEVGMAQLAKSCAQWALARPNLYALPAAIPFLRLGETVYRRPHAGAAPTYATVGILERTMRGQDEEAKRRRLNAVALLSALRTDASARGFDIPAQGQPGYLRLPLLVSKGAVQNWRTKHTRRRGVQPGYPSCLADLEGFGGRISNPEERFSGARELTKGLHTLPTHSLLEPQDIEALSAWLSGL
ncbi:MAG TPA: DegT/DnrJ/EryC1/StrS family aminotransferase [Gemmatimonadales bacterium]